MVIILVNIPEDFLRSFVHEENIRGNEYLIVMVDRKSGVGTIVDPSRRSRHSIRQYLEFIVDTVARIFNEAYYVSSAGFSTNHIFPKIVQRQFSGRCVALWLENLSSQVVWERG